MKIASQSGELKGNLEGHFWEQEANVEGLTKLLELYQQISDMEANMAQRSDMLSDILRQFPNEISIQESWLQVRQYMELIYVKFRDLFMHIEQRRNLTDSAWTTIVQLIFPQLLMTLEDVKNLLVKPRSSIDLEGGFILAIAKQIEVSTVKVINVRLFCLRIFMDVLCMLNLYEIV